MLAGLALFARYGRFVLVAGLLAGLLLPTLAATLKNWLPQLIAFLLFMSALRIGPYEAVGKLKDLRFTFSLMLIYQIAVPVVLYFGLRSLGVSGPLLMAITLVSSASSISGSANMTILTGNDPAPALRLLIVGTACLPLTVLPIFSLFPELGSATAVFIAAGKLLAIIALATMFAFALRYFILPEPSPEQFGAIDGVSAFGMAVLVVGLMSAVGPALETSPLLVLGTLLAAFVTNFSLQIGSWLVLGRAGISTELVAYSIIGGNRNSALFLAALPTVTTDPILLFIGCYQIPMYLTPILLRRLYVPR